MLEQQDDEKDARMVAMFRDGYTVSVVAMAFNVSREMVERALRRAMKERTCSKS